MISTFIFVGPLALIRAFREPSALQFSLHVSYHGIRVAVGQFRQPRSNLVKLYAVKVDLGDWLWAVKRSIQDLQRPSAVEVQGGGTVVYKIHWE